MLWKTGRIKSRIHPWSNTFMYQNLCHCYPEVTETNNVSYNGNRKAQNVVKGSRSNHGKPGASRFSHDFEPALPLTFIGGFGEF